MQNPPVAARLGSGLVRIAQRYAPMGRGKWWLRRKSSGWLVTRLETGPWIRISGVSDFEWSVLDGHEQSEDRTSSLFREHVAPGNVVFDVGANVGFYSLTAASMVGPSGRVVAFEPGPKTSARLRENAALNGFANLVVVEVAVSDKPGVLHLHLGEDSEANSLYDAGPAATGSVEVSVLTLDAYAEAEGIARVDLLKIDAEGAEVGIIRGARRILTGPDAPPVIVEANPVTLRTAGESVDSLRAEVEALGYTVEVIEAMPWRGEVVENWLAKKPHHR